jgi:hypothetical protein
LAKARPAASHAATFGIATATVIAVAGIIAGPAVMRCSSADEGVLACLHERLADSGLSFTDLSLSAPSSTAPSQAIVDVPRQAGWIEANAGEYEPPTSAVAELVAPGGTVSAFAETDPLPVQGGRAAPSAPTGSMAAGGTAQVADLGAAVDLTAPRTRFASSSDAVAGVAILGDGGLRPAPGRISAGAEAALPSSAINAVLARPGGTLATTGSAEHTPDVGGPVALTASRGTLGAGASPYDPIMPISSVLEPSRGSLSGGGGMADTGTGAGDVALLRSSGAIQADGASATPAESASIVLMRLGTISAAGAGFGPSALARPPTNPALAPAAPALGGRAGTARGEGAVVYLDLPITVSPEVTGSVVMASAQPAEAVLDAALPPLPAPAAPASAEPAPSPILLSPSVIAVPPPAKGGDSSFVLLKLN